MNIVDSSFWIDYFGGGTNSDKIDDIVNNSNILIIPTIILTEVFKWILREISEDSAKLALATMKTGQVIELNEQIAVDAAFYGNKYKLHLADSIIYATAMQFNATIYTLDKHFKDLQNVKYYEKN